MTNKSKTKTLVTIIIFILIVNAGYFVIAIKNCSFSSEFDSLRGPSNLRTQALDDLGHVDSLDLTILSDNYPNGDLSTEWGLAILVETADAKVLIDTGQSYSTLRDNTQALNKDLSDVDFVVISHEHLDHRGGLSYVEELNPGVTVYVTDHIDSLYFNIINSLNLNVVRINETTKIQRGFAIVGELNGPPYEQALVVNVKDVGLIIFVGCSHPGVENLITKTTTDLGLDPYMVIGGFHMTGANEQQIDNTIDDLLELGVDKIYPIHCCGDLFREYMANHYSQQYGQANVGFQMTINAFTINWIIYFVLIPIISVSVLVVTGWFLRKRLLRKRA
jgi:7,8-dihydropterin-6-yl-methyl-4-(beta-D-ribofuranosyl)aminobenzene 5'-phosphate synthase